MAYVQISGPLATGLNGDHAIGWDGGLPAMTPESSYAPFEMDGPARVDDRPVVVTCGSLSTGAKEGHWLKVDLDGNKVLSATIDEGETAKARQRIMEKLERLGRGEHTHD